jgi:hypothetical protein
MSRRDGLGSPTVVGPRYLLRNWAPRLAVALLAPAFLSCHADLRFDELSTCATDVDCLLPSMHCASGQCVACAIDANCTGPGFPRCDVALHRCVECGISADCGSTQVCRAGRCATPCTAGCPAAAPICDDLVCAQCDDLRGCQGSASRPFCLGHVCSACKDDTSCGGATPRCDPVTHSCVHCQQNADCPSNAPLCDVGVGTCAAIP